MNDAPAPPRADRGGPWLLFFADLTLVYPLCMMVTLYCAWLSGWVQLGHPPRVSWDDPKFIGGLTTFFYHYFTVMLIGALPMMLFGSFANLGYVLANQRDPKVEIRGFLLAAFWGAAILLLITDPGRVVEWYGD